MTSSARQATLPARRVPVEGVAERLQAVQARLDAALAGAGRTGDARLLLVTKFVGPDRVAAAAAAGQRHVAESRAQELARKRAALADVPVAAPLVWEFVGRLQRNKVRDVVGHVALIHSVDRPQLVDTLRQAAARVGSVQDVLVQVNVDGDPSKAGAAVARVPALLTAIAASPSLRCRGLMTVPALDGDPRPTFAALRGLRDRLRGEHPDCTELSMGMSGDLEVAIAEGATVVRVGRAVFGPRPQPPPPSTRRTAGTGAT